MKIYLVIALGISLVLLGVTHLPFFETHPHWQLFLKEVAFALLIACIFGITIERVQRREFVKLVTEEREVLKRDVFLYAYGHNIPEEIREEIRSRILYEPFYRRDLTIEWEFSEIPNEPEALSLKKEYSYLLVNNSAEDRDCPFEFTQIGVADQSTLGETEFNVLRIQHKDKVTEWRSKDMKEERPAAQPHMRKFSTMFRVQAQQTVHIYFAIRANRKQADEDNYSSRHPVAGKTTVRLRILPPLRLDVTVACKTQPLRIATDSEPPNKYSYYIEEGLLPYQGIIISWASKEVAETQAGQGQ